MKNTQATIRDIALKLNVSISTVSRALRNARDINPNTKQSVLDLAEKLHYEPNRVAQSLRSKRTFTLGIVVPEIMMHFFSSAISGIQEEAASHNYSVMIGQSLESFESEISNVNKLVANRVDGLLISLSSQTQTYDHLHKLIQKKTPIVLFDRVCDELNVSKVTVDNHDGAFKAVAHLIETGCRRIAFVGGPDTQPITQKRKQGYLDALAQHNIAVDEDLIVHCENTNYCPTQAAKRLLDLREKPDAIFCTSDSIVVSTMMVLKERLIVVPDQISIVGFTNEPISRYIEPSLTTVSQAGYDIGKAATELFMMQVNADEETFQPVTRVVPTKLVIRNSTRKPS